MAKPLTSFRKIICANLPNSLRFCVLLAVMYDHTSNLQISDRTDLNTESSLGPMQLAQAWGRT